AGSGRETMNSSILQAGVVLAVVIGGPGPPGRLTRAADEPAAKPPTFDVVVVAEDGNRPIPGGTVRAYLDPGEKRITTGADGVARGLKPSAVNYTVTIDAWADGYEARRAWWSVVKGPRYRPLEPRVTVALKRGELTVGGRVLDEEGRPIPGVEIELRGMRQGDR